MQKMYICEKECLVTFETNDKMIKCFSELGFNDIKFPFAYGEESIYVMLHRRFVMIQKCEYSTQNIEYQYLNKKDGELKGDNITDGNEG